MLKSTILSLVCLVITFLGHSQTSSKTTSFTIDNKVVVSGKSMYSDLQPQIKNRVLPKPHPGTDRETVRKAKEELEQFRTSGNGKNVQQEKSMGIAAPVMYRNFNGNNFNGFVPNDNDMAISNHDQVCSVTNTSIWSRDQTNNTNYGTFTLHSITNSLGLPQEEFDPKVIYDPLSDRFIMVCLNGFTDSTSNILVGFSQDSTSHNSWNFYALPGDPLNNNLWTDFPMIALSENELFITVNLLYNDSTWQAGFNESVIWQINKNEGYSGSALNPLLHSDIKYNNEPLRNLCPVKGGSTLYGPNMYFLSNRNFTVSNDTIFLVVVTGEIGLPAPTTIVDPLISNISYRMPIDAQQPFTDLLIVNDARILGAFYENDKIQFVFNMLDTVSGKTGIYHGILDFIGGPAITANLYVNDTIYLAYPNIAYAGINSNDNTAVMSVLLSSPNFQPGTAAFKSDGTGQYSDLTVVKAGTGYTNMLNGNERWGDYTGCQTRYNLPGWVWVSGSYSVTNHTTRTWIGELGVNTGVSVPEINEANTLLFPNPADEKTEIQFTNNADGMVNVELLDINGRLVMQLYQGRLVKGPNSFSFNTTSLSSGTYMVRITDATGNVVANEKLIRK